MKNHNTKQTRSPLSWKERADQLEIKIENILKQLTHNDKVLKQLNIPMNLTLSVKIDPKTLKGIALIDPKL